MILVKLAESSWKKLAAMFLGSLLLRLPFDNCEMRAMSTFVPHQVSLSPYVYRGVSRETKDKEKSTLLVVSASECLFVCNVGK